jgi:hypothetical protein
MASKCVGDRRACASLFVGARPIIAQNTASQEIKREILLLRNAFLFPLSILLKQSKELK